MSNLKQKYKDYLIKNEVKDLTDLVNYVEILRNTSNLKGEDRQMLFDFAFLITNEQLSLKSFFAENKIDYTTTPSKEFYNAFKQTTSSPTFMDEVLEQANKEKWNPLNELHERAGREMFNTIKDEDGQFNSTRHKSKEGETHTEIPNFNESVGFQMKRGKTIIYKPKQEGKKEEGVKLDSKKPKIALLFKQFPKALEAIARCSEYGHEKYKDTDSDYLNFKRVKEGSEAYANAGLRHRLQKGIDLESMLPHRYHVAWNALAELELLLEDK